MLTFSYAGVVHYYEKLGPDLQQEMESSLMGNGIGKYN